MPCRTADFLREDERYAEEKDHTCISGFCPYCIRYNRICDGSIFRNVYAAEEVHTERLADFADLLDDGQEEELEAKLDQVSEDYGCDVVVVTEEALDGAVPQDYADDFFDYNDYGMGEDKSGILFLITMSERKWCISTHGEAISDFY